MKHSKNWISAIVVAILLVIMVPVVMVRAEGMDKASVKKAVEAKTTSVYDQINFDNSRKLSREVFNKAYLGYLNLKDNGAVNGREIISICDFSLSSTVPRLWVIDLKSKKVLFNTLVAHGQGSGEEFATKFSNTENSHQSSMGFYVTENTYYGSKGYSLKIHGKDAGYNDQAYNRAVVIHGADYVSYDFIKSNNRLGRSWGCPALPQHLNRNIIDAIKGGTAMFIYSDNDKYLASSKWLNRNPNLKMDDLMPKENDQKTMLADNSIGTPTADLNKVSDETPKPKVVTKKEIPTEAFFQ